VAGRQAPLGSRPWRRARSRRVAVALVAGVAGALLVPAVAQAHGLVQRANLPIPEWLFGTAAAVVLAVSFAALALLWPEPRLEGAASGRPVGGIGRRLAGRGLDSACQAIGALLLVLVIVAGFAGTQDAERNFSPTFVYITFWVGLALASVLFGDVFRAFNPWRAIGRATGWLAQRARRGRPLAHRSYPERLGRWPAAAGLLAFTWLELSSVGWGEQPDLLATAACVYSLITFAGMAVYGVEPWISRAEAFSVYFNLFSRISILGRREGTVRVRRPLSGLTELDLLPGTIAVIVVMIGTVTYDGLSQGEVWTRLAQDLNDGFEGLGLGQDAVSRLTATVGLALGVGAVGLFYWLGVLGARSVGGDQTARRLGRGFVHSLVPIALVYVIAHYLTFFLFEGQQILALISDPLGRGWDLLGTAGRAIDFGVISQNQAWYAQVAVVVAGHVAALILAHERALILYRLPRLAVRSQYWMLGVMVGFTSLALWLLAQAGTGINVVESSEASTAPRSSRLVDLTKRPPFVNALAIDPVNQDFLLTTNRGFWRISKDGSRVNRVRATITYRGKRDTVGTFLLAEPVGGQRFVGSGHPDNADTLPQFLGYIESEDGGRTWRSVTRMGDADLHKIEFAGRRMYAYDAVLSAILTSDDGGRTFTEHFTPRGLIIDFAVNPADPDTLVAANDDELFRSRDGGESWRPVLRASRMRLAWPAPGYLYRADRDGTVYTSADGGRTWREASQVEGEPYKLRPVGPRHLYMALSDATILETTDAAKTWRTVFRP
jgi:hypothetical protein